MRGALLHPVLKLELDDENGNALSPSVLLSSLSLFKKSMSARKACPPALLATGKSEELDKSKSEPETVCSPKDAPVLRGPPDLESAA